MNHNKKQISAKIPRELVPRVDKFCKAARIKKQDFLEHAIRGYLDTHEPALLMKSEIGAVKTRVLLLEMEAKELRAKVNERPAPGQSGDATTGAEIPPPLVH